VKRPQTAVVICNGRPPSSALLRRLTRGADLFIAADGGANLARRAGVQPHVIIGDLDSIDQRTRRAFAVGANLVRVKRQDNTDLEKALDYLLKKKCARVIITAATGRRIDFTLGNLSVIWSYTARMKIAVVGDGWTAVPVRRELRIRGNRGTLVSLIPFGACSGITLRGLKYPLRNAQLKVGEIAVSNVVKSSPFSISVRRGRVLAIVHEDLHRLGVEG
jgi:thiamine pyrophosphokinase